MARFKPVILSTLLVKTDNIWTSTVNKKASMYCVVLYCIVLMGWSLLLNALRPFQDIFCSPEFRYY